ncbi:VOC family protein [Nocardiopsis ganjiahuensis]|uniref:VOC family protein n=1 Tax=Nocardiopsis ganjiahuensis TaxID=239984 RepID=UPI00034921DC|nr:VOC family protein [Nocardiopsis ganjiahuensis]
MSLGTVDQWVVNAVEPSALARFWALVLGGDVQDREDGWAVLRGASGLPRLSFQPTPEAKHSPNRIHLDVLVGDIGEAVHAAVEYGASPVGEPVTDEQGSFQVLRDPEGNEFCLVKPTR